MSDKYIEALKLIMKLRESEAISKDEMRLLISVVIDSYLDNRLRGAAEELMIEIEKMLQ